MQGWGKKNSYWKGDKAGYGAMHGFARRNFGRPSLCEMCGTASRKFYHWAAKNHEKGGHLREDWLRLCVPCHCKYDGKTGKPRSEETKRKIGAKNAITALGNKSALGHRLSPEKRKEISEKTKLGMLNWKLRKQSLK